MGIELHLKPLSQAQLSRESGEHESTVSRILQGKRIDTPTGVLPLKFFCQSKGEVVRRLIAVREHQELASGKRKSRTATLNLQTSLNRNTIQKLPAELSPIIVISFRRPRSSIRAEKGLTRVMRVSSADFGVQFHL